MNIKTVLEKLNLTEFEKGFAPNDYSIPEKPEPDTSLLQRETILENTATAGLNKDATDQLLKTAERISGDIYLSYLFNYSHHLLFKSGKHREQPDCSFPDMKSVLGPEGPTFLLLLALSGIPDSKKYLSENGIPQDVAGWAYYDISLWCHHFMNETGEIGIAPYILDWEYGLMFGRFYRLGRLQFNIRPFKGRLRAYRNIENNAVIALMEGGLELDSKGQFNGVDGVYDNKGKWESSLFISKHEVTGNPVSPLGYVQKKTMTLSLDEWKEELAPGDPVLDTHIPAGVPLTVDACVDSFSRADKFFAKHFPDKTFKGWACHSWLLDVQYEKILPEKSNIIKFQREYYLYPIEISGKESYKRVFGENYTGSLKETHSYKTSMQKAVAEFTAKGGRLRSGGAFFLRKDLPFGRQRYRNSYAQI